MIFKWFIVILCFTLQPFTAPCFPLHLLFSLPPPTMTHSFFSSSRICLFHPQSLSSMKLRSIYSNKNTHIFQLKIAADLFLRKKVYIDTLITLDEHMYLVLALHVAGIELSACGAGGSTHPKRVHTF